MVKFTCPCCGKTYDCEVVDGKIVVVDPSIFLIGDQDAEIANRYEFGVVPWEEVSDGNGER